MKIVNVDSWRFSQEAKSIYSEIGDYKEFNALSREEFINVTRSANVLILRLSQTLDKDFFDEAKQLKFIICNVTGLDHIDLNAANQYDVKIISLKGHYDFLRNIHATAELTWGLILASVRNICASDLDVKQGRWNRNDFFGTELFGKTLGILGYGRIGEKIAKYGEAFGMRCHAYDPSPLSLNKEVYYFDSIESFLSSGIDILSVNVSYSAETHHLLDKNTLALLKTGVVIVNTSRGGIIDESALIASLKSKKIANFAADVLENENSPTFFESSSLLKLSKIDTRVLITPHIGGVTSDSWTKTEVYCAELFKGLLCE